MKRALIAAILSALATAAVLATVGFGAANKSSPAKKSSSRAHRAQTATTPPPTMKEALADAEKRRAAQQEKLAKALGVSADKLQSALDSIKKKNLDQAVKDNKLTADERDAILACDKAPLTCDRSNLPAYGFFDGPGFGGPGFGGPGFGGPDHMMGPPPGGPGPMLRRFKGAPGAAGSDFVKDLAAELGISEDKVTEALKSVRPALPKGERGWHIHGPDGDRYGFGPPPAPPASDGAAAPAAPQEAPSATA
jgi:biotin operon repressor